MEPGSYTLRPTRWLTRPQDVDEQSWKGMQREPLNSKDTLVSLRMLLFLGSHIQEMIACVGREVRKGSELRIYRTRCN
jgi:hypothetical protein